MKRFLAALALIFALASPSLAQIGTAQSSGALTGECNTLLASGQAGGMTAAAVRQCIVDIIASFANTTDLPMTTGPWTSFTPTVSCGGGSLTTLGTVTARYFRSGKFAVVNYDITVTVNGSCAISINATTPPGVTLQGAQFGMCYGREAVTSGIGLLGLVGVGNVAVVSTAAAYPGGSGSRYLFMCTYETL